MVDILSDIVQVIVLSSRANALLSICRPLERGKSAHGLSQKDALELVHAGIGKQERGVVVGHARRRRPKHVRVLLHEKIDKGRSDLVHWPFHDYIIIHFG